MVASPGDIIYYPVDFWHQTVNLDTPSIAITGTSMHVYSIVLCIYSVYEVWYVSICILYVIYLTSYNTCLYLGTIITPQNYDLFFEMIYKQCIGEGTYIYTSSMYVYTFNTYTYIHSICIHVTYYTYIHTLYMHI